MAQLNGWHNQLTNLPTTETTVQPALPHMQRGANATMRHEQEPLLKQLEQSWQFGTLPANAGSTDRLLHQAVLRVVGPLVAQQREFNAALVKFLYTLQDRGRPRHCTQCGHGPSHRERTRSVGVASRCTDPWHGDPDAEQLCARAQRRCQHAHRHSIRIHGRHQRTPRHIGA